MVWCLGPLIFKESLPINRRKCIIDKLKLKNATSISVSYAAADAKAGDAKKSATVNPEELAPVLNDLFQLEFPESEGIHHTPHTTHRSRVRSRSRSSLTLFRV